MCVYVPAVTHGREFAHEERRAVWDDTVFVLYFGRRRVQIGNEGLQDAYFLNIFPMIAALPDATSSGPSGDHKYSTQFVQTEILVNQPFSASWFSGAGSSSF